MTEFFGNYTYLALMILSLAYPLAQSFEKRVKMYTRFKPILGGILFMMLVFIPWDIAFTVNSFWGFNDAYITGIKLFHLPVEEWMFFLLIPYCCFFVHFVAEYFIKIDWLFDWRRVIGWLIVIVFSIIGLLHIENWYTATAFLGCSSFLTLLLFTRFDFFLGRFWITYLICIIPFVIVNGQLTHPPVVWYNDAQNLGQRLHLEGWANIPLDDFAYNMLMLLMSISGYYYLTKPQTK